MGGVSGISAGILGLSGLLGFFFYLACSLVYSLALFQKMGFQTSEYLMEPSYLWKGGLSQGISTFVLTWT